MGGFPEGGLSTLPVPGKPLGAARSGGKLCWAVWPAALAGGGGIFSFLFLSDNTV